MDNELALPTEYSLLTAMRSSVGERQGEISAVTVDEYNESVARLQNLGFDLNLFIVPSSDYTRRPGLQTVSMSGKVKTEGAPGPLYVPRDRFLMKLDALLLFFSVHPLTGTSKIGFTTP